MVLGTIPEDIVSIAHDLPTTYFVTDPGYLVLGERREKKAWRKRF